MSPNAELDFIVYGATGFTGRLVAEYLLQTSRGLAWAMAGRSAPKLAQVRDELGAPADLPLIVADSDDRAVTEACSAGRAALSYSRTISARV